MFGYEIQIGGDLSVNPDAVHSLDAIHRDLVELPLRRLLGNKKAERVIRETPADRLEELSDAAALHLSFLRQ